MTEKERKLPDYFPILGDKVKKTSGDYKFYGKIVSVFYKKSGARRIVVENEDGMLFIFNEKQLELDE